MGGFVDLVCDYCGKNFEKDISSYNFALKHNQKQFFCSMLCNNRGNKFHRGEYHYLWNGGWFPYYGSNWNRISKAIVKNAKFESQLSGMNDVVLNVHHIYPFRKFIKKYVDICLSPYIPEIRDNSAFKIIPHSIIPNLFFEEANRDDNLIVLTENEHHKYEEMPPTFFHNFIGDING